MEPAENKGTGVDDTLEIPLQPIVPTRNRGPSRCYNVAMVVVYFILLILAVVALGTFGRKQAEITQRQHQRKVYEHTCILFTTTLRYDDKGVRRVILHSAGLCDYVLWGLASVAIVVFVWLIHSIVQAIIGPKIISLLRLIDLLVIVLTFFLSLSLTVTIHSGLDATCSPYNGRRCWHFIAKPEYGIDTELEFFDEINAAKTSSWVTTVFLAVLSGWHAILMTTYCRQVSQRRRQFAHVGIDDDVLPAAV